MIGQQICLVCCSTVRSVGGGLGVRFGCLSFLLLESWAILPILYYKILDYFMFGVGVSCLDFPKRMESVDIMGQMSFCHESL